MTLSTLDKFLNRVCVLNKLIELPCPLLCEKVLNLGSPQSTVHSFLSNYHSLITGTPQITTVYWPKFWALSFFLFPFFYPPCLFSSPIRRRVCPNLHSATSPHRTTDALSSGPVPSHTTITEMVGTKSPKGLTRWVGEVDCLRDGYRDKYADQVRVSWRTGLTLKKGSRMWGRGLREKINV